MPSAASSTYDISESSDPITSSSISMNVPSFLPPARGDVDHVLNTDNTSLTHNTPVSHKEKPSGSTIPKVQLREHIKRKHKSSTKASDRPRKLSMHKPKENKNKADLMSWVKRQLSPEKDADTSLNTISKRQY